MAEALDPTSFEAALNALAEQVAAARQAQASPQPSPRRWGAGYGMEKVPGEDKPVLSIDIPAEPLAAATGPTPRTWGSEHPSRRATATTADVLHTMSQPHSPVPQWLIDQQQGRPSHADNAPWMADQGSDVGPIVRIGAELTGAPSVYRGTAKMLDDDPRFLHKAAGAAEAALGAAPIAGQLIRPVGAALSAATETLPRFMATMTMPRLLEVADNERLDKTLQGALAPEAQAQATQWQPPTKEQKLNKAWVMGEQDRLIKKGLYSKDAPGYGTYGTGTEEALKREWRDEQIAERDRVHKEQMEQKRLELESTQAETAKQEAATKKANEDRAAKAAGEAGDRKMKADAARDEIRKADENDPFTRFARGSVPYLATIPGAIVAHYLGKGISSRVQAGAEKRVAEAEQLLSARNPNHGDKIGALNAFYGYPGAQSLWPWQKPEPLFLGTNSSKPPFWRPNKDAPPSSELYPASKGYVANMAAPAILGGGEMASGIAGSHWQEGKKDAAQAAFDNPNASEADVRGAAARRDSAANAQAWFDALNNFGRGTASYGIVKGGINAAMQTPARPSNIGTVDAWREDVMKQIAKTKASEAAKTAKAKAAQPAGTAPAPGAKPNGAGSAAPLVPLAAGPLLPGSTPREESYQDGSESSASPDLPEHLAPTPWGVRDRASGKFTKSPDSSRMSVPAKGERTDNAPPLGYSRPNKLLELAR